MAAAGLGAAGVAGDRDSHERSRCQSEVASAGASGAIGADALGATDSSKPVAAGSGVFMPGGMASLSGFGAVAEGASGGVTEAAEIAVAASGAAGAGVAGGALGSACPA